MELTQTVQPWVSDPPDEPCGGTDALPVPWFAAPLQFVEDPLPGLPSSEWRLIQGLREAAQTKDAMQILVRAAVVFYKAAHPPANETVELGNALADLAVSGREAYKSWPLYGEWPENETTLKSRTRTQLPASATDADVEAAVGMALDRAYKVAWALRGPAAYRATARPLLGWIAVSGEDDSPHRPVNVAAPRLGTRELEQFELPVSTLTRTPTGSVVPGSLPVVTVRTRFFIASAIEDVVPANITPSLRALPPDPVPHVPGGHEVILFLHGHSSSAEEALAIIPHLHAAGLARGVRYSVVSFDLPNSGYTETFDHTSIPGYTRFRPWEQEGAAQITTPVLDFTEDFVVAFVDALENVTPVKGRFAGVIGGSLGGNLGLRLGRRPGLAANPWLTAGIVSWSAASVWEPMVDDFFKSAGPMTALDRASELETPRSRADYFYQAYDQTIPFVNRKPPELWYSSSWTPCKEFHIAASRVARQEIYNANFRRWHWRLAGEQLIYSHVDRFVRGDTTSHFRYEDNTVHQLLVAGEDDDFLFAGIFSATQQLAKRMVNTPGRSLFLARTGHSIHVERPRYFAGEIVRFLTEARRIRTDMAFLEPLLLGRPVVTPVQVMPVLAFLEPLLLSGPEVEPPQARGPDLSFVVPLLLTGPT
jgi:pimeloyl-ACP methyl ester carboxylesterase